MPFLRPASHTWLAAATLLWAAWGCASPASIARSQIPAPTPEASAPTDYDANSVGLLLMAHGGGGEWNDRVQAAIADLRGHLPVTVAFGMANPHTLQSSLDSLRDRGVGTVAVVRLFVSGASFLHPAEYLFGLRSDPPARAMIGHRMVDGHELAPLRTDARILLDRNGMVGSDEAARILLARAKASSSAPAETGALLIAHGMGDEGENKDLLAAMEETASVLRQDGFAEVGIATLREDWAVARTRAEQEIKATVARMQTEHATVVVIPYRVSGFGPYAKVLEGLDYVATEGLLPHRLVTAWIAGRATASLCEAGLPSPLGPCDMALGLGANSAYPEVSAVEVTAVPRSAAAVALVAVFSAVEAAAQPQGTQRLGRIYDSESGAAIAGARVEWLAAPEAEAAAPAAPAAPSVSQSTDSRGAFQLGRAWDPGGTVVVSALGYRQRTLPWHDAEVNGWRIGLDRDPFALDEILVTAGGRARRRSEVAVPIETIEATEIHAAGAPSVDRLLVELPGLQVSAGVPTGSNLLIRGIGGARVLVLLDGRPAPGSLIENRDLSRMSLAGVERVEVVKGPLSSLYGSDALGGVVNVITRAPTRGFRIDGRVLSGGLGRRQADLTASGGGRLRFRITGAWRQEDQMPGVVSAVGEGFARVWDLRSDVRYDANEVWDLGGGLNLLRERQRWPVGGGFSGFNDNTGMSGWLEARRLAGPGEWTTTALVQDYEHLYRSARGDAPIASDDDAPQWERETSVSYQKSLRSE